jgi:hypothetical protein
MKMLWNKAILPAEVNENAKAEVGPSGDRIVFNAKQFIIASTHSPTPFFENDSFPEMSR